MQKNSPTSGRPSALLIRPVLHSFSVGGWREGWGEGKALGSAGLPAGVLFNHSTLSLEPFLPGAICHFPSAICHSSLPISYRLSRFGSWSQCASKKVETFHEPENGKNARAYPPLPFRRGEGWGEGFRLRF